MGLTDNLINYWKLDETTGTNADDSVGTNDGTLTNATFVSGGKINYGVNFDGSGDFVTLTKIPNKTEISISCRVKFTSQQTVNAIMVQGATASQYIRLGLTYTPDVIRGGGRTVMRWGDEGSSFGNDTVLNTGIRYHIVSTRASDGTAKVYINAGTPAVGALTGSMDQTGEDMYFGMWRAGDPSFLNGLIDEVGIRDRVLSSTEVADLYNAGAGNQYPFTPTPPTSNSTNFFQMFG